MKNLKRAQELSTVANSPENIDPLELQFAEAKTKTMLFIKEHNDNLPHERCPKCNDDGHVPGIRCAACGYRHKIPWAILRDTEWGYEAIALTDRNSVLVEFKIES